MAEGIVSFVLDKLLDAAVKEFLLIHGVGEQVETLSRELGWIQSFLKDADMKNIVNEREKYWVKEVRDIAYDIEDVIDNASFLKAPETGNHSKEHSTTFAKIFKATKTLLGKRKRDPALHNLAVEMNKILARIQEINESRVKYGIHTLGEGSGARLRLPVRPPVLPEIDDPDVVGIDRDRDNIVKKLLDRGIKRRTVISIVGPGGLGKTTLARKVYNSDDVKRQFDVRIWVVISQEFNLIDILRKIIKKVEKYTKEDDLEGGEEYLLTKLYKTLVGEEYTKEDYLHPNSRDPQAGKNPYEESSLELLFKKALPNRDLIEGYPDELFEWIIATSYDDLPFVLKSCFMYFAAFHEDHEIDAKIIFWMWVAERLIPAEESRTLEDTAESFLEDLVKRSLIQVSKRSPTSSITGCRIHDLLRELAIQKAKEDNFLTICSNPDNWKSSAKARRVAVHYSGCGDINELMEHANPNLRSLLCFEKPLPNCSRQRLLKVLGQMGQIAPSHSVDFEYFHGLNQLRYCELRGQLNSNKWSFHSFVSSLKFVETLDFGRLLGQGDLPDDIWNVKTLRHVKLCSYASGPSSSADLRNLQTLVSVNSRESWDAQLPKLPNLRDLDIGGDSSFTWDLVAKLLGTLNHLTSLSLCGLEVPQKIVEMQRFPFYQHLQSLCLVDKGPSPDNKLSLEVAMFPIHVTTITLFGIQFNEDPLPVLEKLRSLRMLLLISENENRKMSISAGGFQQLHELMFYGLTNLAEWEIMEGAMPILKVVKLNYCAKLRVPLGLQYLSSLKELHVDNCSELKENADEIRNDICKHVPHISIKPL
ncbi:putative disease resistance RPP8-like protein 2 [Carex rostrata]